MYYQSAAYRYQVQVQRAQATRMMATVRIKKVCDTADKKWTGKNKGLVVGAAFVIPIPRVPVVPPVTTIPKPNLDTGNFSFPSLPKVPSAQDLANGIVGWFIGDYIQKIAKNRDLDTGKWAKGSYKTEKDSLEDHFDRHGEEVGAKTVEEYLRKAEEFARTAKKGVQGKPVKGDTPGVKRYRKNGKYIDLAPDGSVISFGK
ncbi:hypothetical protein RV06_GL002037 [Enterococcus haemoperoxidus]|nr:hypothetical protein RV06_GL002037 [Enterococcus haemoperoxidus]